MKPMVLDLARAASLVLSILSLYWVMLSAFFVPGTHWQERLALCAMRVAIAASVCCASGLLFALRAPVGSNPREPLVSTLPVRLFFWGLGAMGLLFLVSWYLEEYYIPLVLKS